MIIKTTLKLSFSAFVLGLMSSCSAISYSPKVSLDISPETINKSISVELFKDNTSEEDRKNPFAGASVTNKQALINDLAVEVTNAVVIDFSVNAVFKEAKRKVSNPDYIITGEINKFTGTSKLTNFGIISACTILGVYTWILGMPVRKNETNMQLVVTISNNKGEKVGTYTGVYQDKQTASMYTNILLAIPSQTNKSFSATVAQIREQIMKDSSKYK